MNHKLLITSFLFFFCVIQVIGQDYDEYSIDEFYKKVQLDYETLDEEGNGIDFIFIKTDMKPGKYEIVITDGPGDLYEVKGTDFYIKFRGFYGYAGYSDEGILDVGNSAYSSTFYKKED